MEPEQFHVFVLETVRRIMLKAMFRTWALGLVLGGIIGFTIGRLL